MTEPPERSKTEILSEIYQLLNSNDEKDRLSGLNSLSKLNFSNPAILERLETIATKEPDESLRSEALANLKSPIHLFIYKQKNRLTPENRKNILGEISSWEKTGLINLDQAEVLRSRYSFDLVATRSSQLAAQPSTQQPAVSVSAKPRVSLTQTLLSETSVKIYLYLGAFFVIVAALILAALVETLRLPILLAVTGLFGFSAIALKRRLSQPSFILWLVFSTLLPINAKVLADLLSLPEKVNSVYWMIILAVTTLIWAFSTWLYNSHFFTLAAFVSLAAATWFFADIISSHAEFTILCEAGAGLIGLVGVFALTQWRGAKFSLPLFGLVQIFHLVLMFIATLNVVTNLFDVEAAHTLLQDYSWLTMAMVWLISALFYLISNELFAFRLFPWMAAGSMLPVGWLLTRDFSSYYSKPQIISLWISGVLLALMGEIIPTFYAKAKEYRTPLILGSAGLFAFAGLWGLFENVSLGFACLLGTVILYTIFNRWNIRWWLWTITLVAAISAYFAFFALPFLADSAIEPTVQIFGISLLCLMPDIIFGSDIKKDISWRLPPRLFGALFSIAGILLTVIAGADNPGRAALILGLYALLFLAYSLRGLPKIFYLFSSLSALTVLYTLNYFDLSDWWLAALSGQSILFYFTGIYLHKKHEWGNMLRFSGLAIGLFLAMIAPFIETTGRGWYVAVAGLLFTIEMYRNFSWMELVAQVLFGLAYVLILWDADVHQISYYLMGIGIQLFSFDLFFERTLMGRKPWRIFILGAGALAVIMTTILLILGDLNALGTLLVTGTFALVALALSLLHRKPVIGYAFTFYLTGTVLALLRYLLIDNWLYPMIGLALIYYTLGWLDKPTGWGIVRRYSGVILATLTALSAPFENSGLAASVPVAIAATIWAVEALRHRNVWLGFPANALYLMAYFMILYTLKVDQPQFYSVGAAMLGLLMHYLLMRAGSNTGAFITGMVSQLVLLGTTYIQMVNTNQLSFFSALFFQSLVVLVYGIVIRSRSLVITPIVFVVVGTVTVLFSVLKGISTVILIGCTGMVMITLGILAVILRERISRIGERMSEWKA